MLVVSSGGKTRNALRAVVFDFFGTVARHPEGDGSGFPGVFERLGYRLDPAVEGAHFARYDGVEHVEQSADRETYEAWVRMRHGLLARACGVPERGVEALLEALRELDAAPIEAFDDAIPTLLALRARGVRVAICSNWGWDLDRSLAECELLDLVDAAVTSARAGARKPHPRIYKSVLDEIGTAPAETLFVGDSVGPDVVGPMDFGMSAAHIRRPGALGPAPQIPDGALRLSSLTELLDWPALGSSGRSAAAG